MSVVISENSVAISKKVWSIRKILPKMPTTLLQAHFLQDFCCVASLLALSLFALHPYLWVPCQFFQKIVWSKLLFPVAEKKHFFRIKHVRFHAWASVAVVTVPALVHAAPYLSVVSLKPFDLRDQHNSTNFMYRLVRIFCIVISQKMSIFVFFF